MFQDNDGRHTSGTVRVENTRDTDIDTILTLEAVGEGLGHTLALVVASTGTDRVDVAPAVRDVSRVDLKSNGETH